MGWIERLQNSGGESKCEDLVARRIAKGLGFPVSKITKVEKAFGIKMDYDRPLIEHLGEVISIFSSGQAAMENRLRLKYRMMVLHGEISNKTYEDNKEKWLSYAGRNLVVMGRKAGTTDGIAYVVVNEDDIPECLKQPKCTLVDREKGKMVFVKEVENLFRDLVVTEKWSLDLEEQ